MLLGHGPFIVIWLRPLVKTRVAVSGLHLPDVLLSFLSEFVIPSPLRAIQGILYTKVLSEKQADREPVTG
jgi:hypothetical protein